MLHEKAVMLAEATANSTAAPDFSGLWRNQMESTMNLTVNGAAVTGTYTSSTSSGGGPVAGPIKGYVSGDLISFLVLWPGGSQTAWVGQLVGGGSAARIKTLWHLVTNVAEDDEDDELWMSIYAGADEFRR